MKEFNGIRDEDSASSLAQYAVTAIVVEGRANVETVKSVEVPRAM